MKYYSFIKIFLLSLFSISLIFGQAETSKISSMPGAFSRMGFGARGMGMGNAMSAINTGNLVSYYNPALSSFQEGNSFQTSYSFLSLDRSLNFLNFTRKFELGKDQEGKPRSVAGISAGIINSGVDDIGEYDNQGFKTGDLSTSENQFFFGVSNRFSEKFAIGLAVKFYYYKLYEDISSTGIGFDIGAIYLATENLTFSLMFSDLNSKYKWDTTELYGQAGTNTENKFPTLKKIGAAYNINSLGLLLAAEFESSNAETNILRFGGEYNIFERLYIRSGLDKWNISNPDFPARPTFGFSYFYPIGNLMIGVDYAFVIEPYSSFDQHIIGLNIKF